ncbi:oligosaccharide flippase family protein [uncultured Sphingomonas sp.]|uniref:oligosaccharide flippase family protein n=1 Tax=uncultured Sphingomonas sp. TaxID=158754 RepID=UPI0035CAD73B
MSFRRSITWAYIGQFITLAITFIGSIFVARLLSPHELGIFAIAMATTGVIQVFTAFGVGSYIVRDQELKETTLDTAFTINAILSVILAGMIFASSFGGSFLFGDRAVGEILRLTAALPLFGIVSFRASVMMQRTMRFQFISLLGVVGNLLTTAVTVVSAFLGASYMSPAYGGLTSAALSTLAYLWVGREYWSIRRSYVDWREITAFGVRLISIGGVAQLTGRMCEIVLGKMQGLGALGLYGRASNLSNMIWSNLYGSATQVIFTQMSKDLRETGNLHATFTRSLRMITAVLWPALIGLAILSKPVIFLLYGERWLPAAAPLSLLMCMQVLSLVYGMNWELFVLRNEMAKQTRLEITRSVIGFVTFAVGATFSLTGAAAGRVVDAAIGVILYIPHVRRLAGTEKGELNRIYLESGLLAVAGVSPAAVLMAATGASAHTPPALIVGSILIGIALWLASAWRMHHPVIAEMLVFGRRVPGFQRLLHDNGQSW